MILSLTVLLAFPLAIAVVYYWPRIWRALCRLFSGPPGSSG